MPQKNSSRRVRDPLSCIPSSQSVQYRLDHIFAEAAKLKLILVLAREVEAAKASDISDIQSDQEGDNAQSK